MDLGLARKHLLNQKNTIGKWFPKEWISEIDGIMNLELKYYEFVTPTVISGYYVLITPEECKNLVRKYLNFDLLDNIFTWTI